MDERRATTELHIDPRLVLVIAAIIGLSARLYLSLTTVGTSDVLFKLFYARMAGKFSIIYAYSYTEALNHPPLSLLLMDWYRRLADLSGLEFPYVFRIVQSIADGVTAATLCRIGAADVWRRASVAFLLCPAVIVVSGFHCNTDPTLLALMVLSVAAASRERFLLSGVLLGASFGIKIVAMFAAPLIFLAAGKRRWEFAAGFVAVALLVFAPVVLIGGPAVVTNVLGYSGWRSAWGIGGLAEWMHHRLATRGEPSAWMSAAQFYSDFGTLILGVALIAFYLLFAHLLRFANPADLVMRAVPIVYLIVLAFAPRFGVQYLTWPLPFLLIAAGPLTYTLTCLVFSAYIFAAYTIWSGGFPWTFADALAPHPYKWVLTDTGFLVWVWVIVAAFATMRRTLFAADQAKYARD